MPTIYQELQATAKLTSLTDPPPVDAEEQEHLSWLAQAVAMTTKEQFEVMTVRAQEWFDAAADSLNTGNPIPVPAGYGEPEAPPAPVRPVIGRPRASALNGPTATPPVTPTPPAMTVSAAPEEPAKEEPAEAPVRDPHPLSQPVPPVQPPEPPAPPQQAEASEKPKRGRRQNAEGEVSVTQRIREYVIERENITVDEIIDRLKDERQPDMSGKRKPTVATLRSDTLRTLGLAKAAGWQPPQHQPQH